MVIPTKGLGHSPQKSERSHFQWVYLTASLGIGTAKVSEKFSTFYWENNFSAKLCAVCESCSLLWAKTTRAPLELSSSVLLEAIVLNIREHVT